MKRHRPQCGIWQARDKNVVASERIQITLQKKYGNGITNAIHIPEAAAKKAKTMEERYGAVNPFSKESTLYDRVQSYWNGKDRTAHLPKDNFARPEIKEKIRRTNLIKYGVENPSQNQGIRAKQLATNLNRYGDIHTFRVPSLRAKGNKTNLIKYGVPDAMQSDIIKEKVRQTNLYRYGVPWTTQDLKTRSAMNASFIKFLSTGRGQTIYSLTYNGQLYKETCLMKYGVTHPMKDPEYARKHLEHSRRAGPNTIELQFNELYPFFYFTGDGSFWKLIPSVQKNKNPDFCFPVSLKDDNIPSFYGTTHVVEIFGNYWHGQSKTGIPDEQHVLDIMNAWAEVNLKCLVIWEKELTDVKNRDTLDQKVRIFLSQ
jgi:hypothetical protein